MAELRGGPRRGKRGADAATDQLQKDSRVNALRYSLPFASQSALGSILTLSAREELPVANRNAIRKARDAAVFEQTEYGPFHKTMAVPAHDGDPVDIEIQNPQAMLSYMCRSNPSFARRIESAFRRKPPTRLQPWSIILYGDEILPGNALAPVTNRKCWGFYWSVLELGPCTLTNEDSPLGARPSLQRWCCNSIRPAG